MFRINKGKHGLNRKTLRQAAFNRRRLRRTTEKSLICERLEKRTLLSVVSWNTALVDAIESENDVIISGSDIDVVNSFDSLENPTAGATIEVADAFFDDMTKLRDGSEIKNETGSDDYADYITADLVDGDPSQSKANLNVALIDATLDDHETLTSSFNDDVIVIEYDGNLDTAFEVLKQVSELSDSAGSRIDSLSILSHGSTGQFELGSELVTSETLRLRPEAWLELGKNLTDGANIYIFGCNVAANSTDGFAILNDIANLTGGDVFASDDLTGRGGDWELEAASNGAENELVSGLVIPANMDVLTGFSGTLPNQRPAGLPMLMSMKTLLIRWSICSTRLTIPRTPTPL